MDTNYFHAIVRATVVPASRRLTLSAPLVGVLAGLGPVEPEAAKKGTC